MSSYHECAREPPSCRGLKQGIKGYHACAKKKNCRKTDRPKRQAQTKLKDIINPTTLRVIKLKKTPSLKVIAPKPKPALKAPSLKVTTSKPKPALKAPSLKVTTSKPKPAPKAAPKPPSMEGAPTTIFKVPLDKLISVVGDILNVYYPEHKIKSTEKQNLQLWKATKKKYNIATITGFKSDVLKIINDTTMPKLFNTNITNMLTRKYQDDFNDQFTKKFKKLHNKLLWYMFTNSMYVKPEPEPELEPVPKPEQEPYKTPPKNKCFDALDLVKTQYTTGFKNIKFEDRIKQTPAYKLYKEMSDVIQGGDFYPTPEKYGKFIYEDATKFNRNSILDIAAGYGNLSYEWIKDTRKKVGIVERNSTFAKLFKCFENQDPGHLKLYNTDYLKMDTPNIDYDVIVCNPPFSKTAFAGKRTDYTFWLLKAMYDGWKMGTKEIYFICPVTILDNPAGYGSKSKIDVLDVKNPQVVTDLRISKTVYKLFTDNFKDWDGILDYDEDAKEYYINYGQIQLMGSISGFQTLGRNNKLKTLNINVVMLKIISFTDKPDTRTQPAPTPKPTLKPAPKPKAAPKPKPAPVITSKKPKAAPKAPKPTKQTIFDVPIKDLLTVVVDVFHSKNFFGKCDTSNNDERLKILSILAAGSRGKTHSSGDIVEYQKDSWAKSKAKYNITGIVKFKSDVMKIVKGADLNELLNNRGKDFIMDPRFHCLESKFKPLLDFIWAFAKSKEAKQEDRKGEKAARKADSARWVKQKLKRDTDRRAAKRAIPTIGTIVQSKAPKTAPAITSQTAKTKNPWLMHVAVVKLENPNIQYKDVLKLAKTTYTKKK